MLQKALGGAKTSSLSGNDFITALKKLNIAIRKEEVNQLLMRFDPSGEAKGIDIIELDRAFEAFQQTHVRDPNSRIVVDERRQKRYKDFELYQGSSKVGSRGKK